MFTYLKQWFHEVMIQRFAVMGRNIVPIINENEENSPYVSSSTVVDSIARNSTGNISNYVDPRELPRPTRHNELNVNNKKSPENLREEIKNKMSQIIVRCWVKRIGKNKDTKNNEKIVDNEEKKKEEKTNKKEEICRCENCFFVSTFSDCGVCLEPLQTRGIKSCSICSNIVCSKCSEKMKNCAFCRSSLPMQKNRAIERIIDGLFMPCINARNGCRKMLNSETRSRHESNCGHATINCPISKICNWHGSPASILGHLKNVHSLKPLMDKGIAMEISSFRQKIMNKQREYVIYLSCYGQLFAVKIVLSRKKMILSFSQLGYVTQITEKIASKKYGVLLKIDVAGKRIRGALPFGKFDREIRDIEVNCEKLYSTRDDISRDVNDNVQIKIHIKEINSTLK